MFQAASQRLRARSAAILLSLESGLERMMKGWLFVALLACSARVAAGPVSIADAGAQSVLSYMLLIIAPVASIVLAMRWFAHADQQPQPTLRLARVGKWRDVADGEARAHKLYGTSGIMVSLLIGLLLNVPVRAAEYLTAIPPIAPQVPQWLATLQIAMTFDVVVFTSLYAIAFVAALRRAPIFPRLLVAIWIGDILMQLVVATAVASTPSLPADVAQALHSLLNGNVKKVMISVGLWLPYLLLSTRVNVTYRRRVPA